MNVRSLFLSALTAGGIVSILLVLFAIAAIAFMVNPNPISNALDENLVVPLCCCAGLPLFVLNGVLGAFFYRRRQGTISIAHGVLVGALSGLVGALVVSLFMLAGILLAYYMATGGAGLGEAILQFTSGYYASVGMYVIFCLGSVIFWSLLGALGGLIGAAILRKAAVAPTT
jgi:hypothetical protein